MKSVACQTNAEVALRSVLPEDVHISRFTALRADPGGSASEVV